MVEEAADLVECDSFGIEPDRAQDFMNPPPT